MWEDPIVKEVRQARLEIEQECDNNFRKIYERALEIQKRVAEQRISYKTQKEKAPLAV
ncbi:MAG: hypothetical protein QOC96_182 [Acidobacteriota bacterium]|jgi:hypothetical protein|nr:hypothetical protein [Acidobacteriota bacterium]